MISYHTCPLATLGGKDTGGMNVYVRDLTFELGRMNIHVDVFTRSQDEHVPHVLHNLGYGNRVVHVPAGPEIPLPKEALAGYLPEFVSVIKEITTHKNLSYDIIHSHYWMSGIAARDLRSAWKTPIIHMFHTLGRMKQRVARSSEEAEGDYRLRGEYEVINTADKIIAATQAELVQLQWLYQADTRKIAIVPPGVDTSKFYPISNEEAKEFIGIPPCENMLLFVGRIEPLKGIDTLIHAIGVLRKRGLTVCLSIIGGDPDSEGDENAELLRLREICEQAGLADLVTFLGKKSQDTLPYYYSAADVVVVPSHYESFGMVALEAMACGKPVVASQVGGLAFLVQDGVTGYTVPVEDVEIMAERLATLLTNPDIARQMGENAAALAHQYSWQSIAEKIAAVYEQQLNKPR
jgi:D-inositol-3-phosphate glycosyltransferase